MNPEPPKLITQLLARICKKSLWESIEGDLWELFRLDYQKKSKRKANLNYLINAIAFLRYHRLRKTQNSNSINNMALIQNYLKVSVRDLKRNRVFAGINLFGLIAGMTVSLLMLEYVLFETNFDDFHKDGDRIYRVLNQRYQNGSLIQQGAITYPTIGPTLKKDFPEVESYTRMTYNTRSYVSYNDELFLCNFFLIADEHFLDVFSFEILHGDPASSLDDPQEVVISESFAKKLLSNNQPVESLIGQQIRLFNPEPYKVNAIVKDPPANSHLQFELLISYKTFISLAGEGADNSWTWSDFYHYIKVKEGTNINVVNEKLIAFGKQYFKDGEVSGSVEEFTLQPLSEVHLDDTQEYEFARVTNGKTVWLLLAIAVFIIMIAWINYINLSTSRAIQRAKEVGIRKSIGAQKGQIIRQSFVEAVLINTIALVISFGLVLLIQPLFNDLTDIQLSLMVLWKASVFQIPFPLFLFGVLFLALSLVAIYPALVVTKFSTQDILKGSFKLKGEINWLKKGMVIFQFAIAVALIAITMGIAKQVNYMLNQDTGMKTDQTMILYGPALSEWDSTFINRIGLFKDELTSLSGVELVTISSRVPGSNMGRLFQITSQADPEAKNLTSNFMNVDHQFSKLYNLEFLAGRDFSYTDHDFDFNSVKNVVLNESAVSAMKFESPTEAIGGSLNFHGKKWTIIGVVKDFHQVSLHERIEPIMLLPYYSTDHNFSIRLSTDPTPNLIGAIETKFNSRFPGNYFDYYFLEDQITDLYASDSRLGIITNVFASLSIVIAILGLYGLVLITVIKKTKEIGVRKVLGANLFQLLNSLGKEFLFLVVVSILVGAPLSYFILEEWKSGYAYNTEIGLGPTIISSAILVIISCITIIFHAKKVARNNPVESLRWE